MPISIVRADITSMKVDAIVNSANPALLAGGGVCGAIHHAAGPELEGVCREIGGCSVGSAVVTLAFNLPCRFVIHAVGPRWFDGLRGEPELLQKCYESIFALAEEYRVASIAIPSISTGIYGYPIEKAAELALRISWLHDHANLKIVFACYDERTLRAYQRYLAG